MYASKNYVRQLRMTGERLCEMYETLTNKARHVCFQKICDLYKLQSYA